MEIQNEIERLQKLLYDFSKRNSFVHCHVEKLWSVGNEDVTQLKKIFKKARFNRKEYGLESALLVDFFLAWTPPGKSALVENQLISPLYYKTCDIVFRRKFSETYEVEVTSDVYIVNPIIRHYFKLFYDYEFESTVDDPKVELERFASYFTENGESKVQDLTNFYHLELEYWSVIHRPSVGVFNYKKSTLGADFDLLKENPNDSVLRLLGGDEREGEIATVKPKLITTVDQSQLDALKLGFNGNASIQGPPGTGKSHLIVGLIGSFMAANKTVLFVSEKRSALDVVYSRLNDLGLRDSVAYFNTTNNQKKEFYGNLKRAWNKRSEELSEEVTRNKFSNSNDLVRYYSTNLRKYREVLGGDLWGLMERLLKLGFGAGELAFEGKIPVYEKWSNAFSDLKLLDKRLRNAFGVEYLNQGVFINLSSAIFNEKEPLVKLESRIIELKSVLNNSVKLLIDFELGDLGIDDLVKLALTASILNMVDKVQINLLDESSKSYKSFNVWAKKFELVNARLNQAIKANEKWTVKPSMSEVNELIDLLTNERPRGNSIFSRLKRNPAKLKTAFSDFHIGIGNHTKIKLLEGIKLEWRLRGEIEQIRLKLKHNLKINDPDIEIDQIFQLRNKLNAVSQNEYLKILEHENSRLLIDRLSVLHPELVRFNSLKRFMFDRLEVESINGFDNKLDDLLKGLPVISKWFPELKVFFGLGQEVTGFVSDNAMSVDKMDAVVVYQKLLKETRFESIFKEVSGWELEMALKRMILNNELSTQEVLSSVEVDRKNRYKAKEALLAMPGFKLNELEKREKRDYKAEKRLVLHEMEKKQRHLSVKSCFGVAGDVLQELQPVWMMNPLSVSENLPCLANLFDVVIFDESSQIPLEDAIPSVYRAGQVVVVGDEEQMPPSRFFSSSGSTRTVLHQSKEMYAFKMLKWHYRSKHPELIRFSNRNFYQNELVCFPPMVNNAPVVLKRVAGLYYEGKNVVEAKAIAEFCHGLSTEMLTDTIVIAFSQEQEREIQRQLKLLIGAMADNIVTRNLENAQGVEAGLVIVSIGYGKNPEGVFRLNLGPVNQANGANRLNVLFTRAIEKMVVFSSVGSVDFPLSDNRGIAILKDFLSYAEKNDEGEGLSTKGSYGFELIAGFLSLHELEFKRYLTSEGIVLNCLVSHVNSKIVLFDPCLSENEVTDLCTVYKRLTLDYKQVKIVLSVDLWQNRERVETELIEFFK